MNTMQGQGRNKCIPKSYVQEFSMPWAQMRWCRKRALLMASMQPDNFQPNFESIPSPSCRHLGFGLHYKHTEWRGLWDCSWVQGPQHCRDITIQWPEMTPKRLTISKRTVSGVVALEAWPVFWITKVAIINGKVRSTFNLFFLFWFFFLCFFFFSFMGFFLILFFSFYVNFLKKSQTWAKRRA